MYCSKSFNQKSSRTEHTRIHSGERPFNCDYCEKSCISSSALTKHERIHTGEKPYKCEYCEKLFSQRSSLTVHTRLHSQEKLAKSKKSNLWMAVKLFIFQIILKYQLVSLIENISVNRWSENLY